MDILEEFINKIKDSQITQEEKMNLINWIKTLPEEFLNLFNSIFTDSGDILMLSQNYLRITNLLKKDDSQELENYIKELTVDLKKSY
jgi:hypothetical protein